MATRFSSTSTFSQQIQAIVNAFPFFFVFFHVCFVFLFVSCHILVALRAMGCSALLFLLLRCSPAYVSLNSVTGVEIVYFFSFSFGGGGGLCLLAILPYPLQSFPSSLTPSCLSGHSIAGTAVLLGVAVPPQSPTGQLHPGWDSSRV